MKDKAEPVDQRPSVTPVPLEPEFQLEREGMKAGELRKAASCVCCGKKILRGIPMFWRVTIDRFIVDLNAVRRQSGLEMMLNSVALAGVMSPDEDMAKPVMKPVTLTICEDCGMEPKRIAALCELGGEGERG